MTRQTDNIAGSWVTRSEHGYFEVDGVRYDYEELFGVDFATFNGEVFLDDDAMTTVMWDGPELAGMIAVWLTLAPGLRRVENRKADRCLRRADVRRVSPFGVPPLGGAPF